MSRLSRRGFLEAAIVVAAGFGVSLAAAAAEQTPKEFLEAIYKSYIGKNTACR